MNAFTAPNTATLYLDLGLLGEECECTVQFRAVPDEDRMRQPVLDVVIVSVIYLDLELVDYLDDSARESIIDDLDRLRDENHMEDAA